MKWKNNLNCAMRNRDSGWGSSEGFTLMEVMIATVLVLVIAMGGFGALIQGNKLIEISRDETRASQVLQSEIEELRSYDWAALAALDNDTTYAPDSSFTDSYSTRYTVRRQITNRSSLQKKVTVQVSWMDNGGSMHMREYITLISKDGLYDFYYRTI